MTTELHEDRLIRSMVLALRDHPAEWLTFKRLSQLVALPDCDENILGAVAEYRHDLFAISNDRKLKLRPNVIEAIALIGIANWKVPARPERVERASFDSGTPTVSRKPGVGCYCNSSYDEILIDIKESVVPDDALLNSCCWKTICRVRGLYFNMVDPEMWRELCQRRGYIQQRENPRGF